MNRRRSNVLRLAQPELGLRAKWGSAAWAQTQLTPGVSALAAPPPIVLPRTRNARQREPMPDFRVWALAQTGAGFSSLLLGMCLLGEHPLLGVLAMLGGMDLLLRSTARLDNK